MMETVLSAIGLVGTAVTVGTMVFFAAVVAPTAFMRLDAENAGKFIRAIFPRYYLLVIVGGGLGALTLLTIHPWPAGGLAVATLCAVIARQGLMPRINGARDQALAGDEAADARFKKLHRASVRLNAVGLLGALAAIVLLGIGH